MYIEYICTVQTQLCHIPVQNTTLCYHEDATMQCLQAYESAAQCWAASHEARDSSPSSTAAHRSWHFVNQPVCVRPCSAFFASHLSVWLKRACTAGMTRCTGGAFAGGLGPAFGGRKACGWMNRHRKTKCCSTYIIVNNDQWTLCCSTYIARNINQKKMCCSTYNATKQQSDEAPMFDRMKPWPPWRRGRGLR